MLIKNAIFTFLFILLTAVGQYFLPWWVVVIPAMAVGFLLENKKPNTGFWICSLSVFFLWAMLAFYLDWQNDHVLGNKMSLLILHIKNSYLLMFVSALLGSIVAGLAAITGHYLRQML